MKQSSKNFWWVLAIIVIAALAYWWVRSHPFVEKAYAPAEVESQIPAAEQKPTSAGTAKTDKEKDNAPADSTTEKENGDILYTNNNHGFSLTFPKDWKGFKAVENENEAGKKSVSFELEHTDGTYGSVFTISFYSGDEWKTAQAGGGLLPTRLAAKGDLIYTYSLAQDDTNFAGYPEPVPGLTYKGPIFEADEIIIPSFRLN